MDDLVSLRGISVPGGGGDGIPRSGLHISNRAVLRSDIRRIIANTAEEADGSVLQGVHPGRSQCDEHITGRDRITRGDRYFRDGAADIGTDDDRSCADNGAVGRDGSGHGSGHNGQGQNNQEKDREQLFHYGTSYIINIDWSGPN